MKVVAIAPYKGLGILMQEVANSLQLEDVEILYGDLAEGVKNAVRAEQEGADLIISRGGTAERIKQRVNIPVIEIEVSGFDVLRVLSLVRDKQKKAAFVGFPVLAKAVSTISKLTSSAVDVYAINKEESIETRLQQLKDQDYTFVVGDVITVELAERIGLHGILLTSGKESVQQAFLKAKETLSYLESFNNKNKQLLQMLKQLKQWILVVDEQQNIILETKSVSSFFQQYLLQVAVRVQSSCSFVLSGKEDRFLIKANRLQQDNLIMYQIEPAYEDEAAIEVRLGQYADTPGSEGLYVSRWMDKARHFKKDEYARGIWLIGESGSGRAILARYLHNVHAPFLRISGKLLNKQHLNELNTVLLEEGTIFVRDADQLNRVDIEKMEKLVKDRSGKLLLSAAEEPQDKRGTAVFNLPPLRDRNEEIPVLTKVFISHFNNMYGKQIAGVEEEGLEELIRFEYPGNVTDLQRIIKQAVLKSTGEYLSKECILESISSSNLLKWELPLHGTLAEIESEIIYQVWKAENQNNTKTAARLGINRTTLWRRLKERVEKGGRT
ncbi:Transcriptional regulator containing PAS, AAA-type ATPase, and DNA-binding Fis domains [Terribacillus halophilus]|uniref:Transcriptional regulator containing PAS, AAA-type ATPase, and DNA-binding Fis domains n=1 Tax=Terribacillus halophilus TaxID=361279 RepID=A0A1G6T2V4_9BACI|nr:sigma-54-dependent Fis family transcriptional regulator [Terribacillus halophilus]SDD23303.1 Transcriptional regulator containing PAS, AAA-type ATPase, and DNA-binding Fis domains [Terribacillus halophilus]